MIKKIISLVLVYTLKPISHILLMFFNSVIIYRFGNSLGDFVYMSSVLREINLRKKKNIILFTNRKEFFINNPRIKILVYSSYGSIVSFILKNIKGKYIMEFNSIKTNSNKSNKHFLYYHKKNIHIVEAMSEHFTMSLDYNNLKNEIFFSEEEKKYFEKKIKLPEKFSLIHSQSKKSFTTNKEWKPEGMQEIIYQLNNFKWIQIGKLGEPKLDNCRILFDLPLRELAFVISKCEFIVCYEGFFNHLASCFNKKTFVIHTGFLSEQAFKYKNNIIIHNNEKIKCYPCYDLICDSHHENVLQNITSEFLVKKIMNNINKLNDY